MQPVEPGAFPVAESFPSSAIEFLSPAAADARWSVTPIAFVPIGPLEFHGPHLPLGLDLLVARGICLRAAERTGGLVFPALSHGTGGEHGDYPFSLMVSAPALESLLRETLERLRRWHATTIVLFTGHMAREQCELLDRLAAETSSAACLVLSLSPRDWPQKTLPPDHAGLFETTLLGGLHPALVHVDRLSSDALPAKENPFGSQRHDPAHPLHGIFGWDPRAYDPARAPARAEALAEWLATEVLARRRQTFSPDPASR